MPLTLTNLLYKDIHFDSDEEVFFAMWLDDLKEKEFVVTWWKALGPIKITKGLKIPYVKKTQLKTKVKEEQKDKILLNPSEYTPDFIVSFSDKGFDKFCSFIDRELFNPNALFFAFDGNGTCVSKNIRFVFEIKPSFDQQNMTRLYKLNQKFIWDKHQIFVNLTKTDDLFKQTFLPSQAVPYFKYKKAPTGKNKGKKGPGDWKMDWEPKTIEQFLNKE